MCNNIVELLKKRETLFTNLNNVLSEYAKTFSDTQLEELTTALNKLKDTTNQVDNEMQNMLAQPV